MKVFGFAALVFLVTATLVLLPFNSQAAKKIAADRSSSERGYLPDVVIFDNGSSNYECCSEITAFTVAEDFELDGAATISGAGFVLQSLSPFPAGWDGTLSWWIYANGGDGPGGVISSGSAENITWGFRQCCDFYDVSFDLGVDVPLDGGTRYWFGLHMAADWSTQDDIYWALTDNQSFSRAQTATGPTGPWTDSAHHLSFKLWGSSAGVPADCLEVLSSWTYGGTTAATLSGNHTFFANGTYLQVADISIITDPQVVGEIDLDSEFWGLDISGDHLLIPTIEGELLVIDISTPAAPEVVTAFRLVSSGFEVLAEGPLAYVSTALGVAVFDISTVTSPVQIGFYPTDDFSYATCLDGTTAYVAAFEDGLHVVDVSDPTSPARLGHLPIGGYQEYVSCTPGFAFLADGADTTDWTGHFRVIDVSTPSAPTQVADLSGYGWLEAIEMWGAYALVPIADSVHVIDVSTPTAPVDVGAALVGGNSMYAAAVANHVFVADWSGGLHVVDLDPVTAPTKVATIPTPGSRSGLAFLDPATLIAAGNGGLTVLDVSDPAHPTVISEIDLSVFGDVYDVEVVGRFAVVAKAFEGLAIIDLDDPANPVEIGWVSAGAVRRIAVDGDYVYVAANGRFEVVDISTPSSPALFGSGVDMRAWDVGIIGDTAFVASRADGLQCVDISSPETPVPIGELVGDLEAFSIGVWDDHVAVGGRLISTSEGAWMIADVQAPTNPSCLSTTIVPDQPRSLTVADGLVFPTSGEIFSVADVGNPWAPYELASRPELAPGYAEPAALAGLIALANGRNGYRIVDYSACIDLLVFADGFESGHALAWSREVP